MSRKKESADPPQGQLDFFSKLDELTGQNEGINPEALDGVILWAVTVLLAKQRTSITLGTTQTGTSWVLQLWDGKIPRKWYFEETQELNRHLAAIIRSVQGNAVNPDIDNAVRQYGW
jgi:hypothetical protein